MSAPMRWMSFSAIAVFLANVAIADEGGQAAATVPPSGPRPIEATDSGLTIPRSITPPRSIPASEHVEGFFVSEPTFYGPRGSGPTFLQVSGVQGADEAMRNGKLVRGPCVQLAYPSGDESLSWGGVAQQVATVQNYRAMKESGLPPGFGAIQAMRRDEVKDLTATTLSLNVKVALIDPQTRGVRLHSEQSLPFTKLSEFPGGVSVWVSLSKAEALFLIRHDADRMSPFLGPISAPSMKESQTASVGCPLLVPVSVGAGISEQRVAELEVVTGVEEPPPAAGPLGGFAKMTMDSVKVRTMRLGLSSTWLSHDTAPVLSVARGWVTKARVQTVPREEAIAETDSSVLP